MKIFKFALVSAAVAAVSGSAFAAGPDMSALTGAVDFASVSTAVLAIAGMLALVYVTIKGANIIMSMIRGK